MIACEKKVDKLVDVHNCTSVEDDIVKRCWIGHFRTFPLAFAQHLIITQNYEIRKFLKK